MLCIVTCAVHIAKLPGLDFARGLSDLESGVSLGSAPYRLFGVGVVGRAEAD